MGKKKTEKRPGKMLSLLVDSALWERFQELREGMIPRVSATALLEAAIAEYIERHQQTKKEGKQ